MNIYHIKQNLQEFAIIVFNFITKIVNFGNCCQRINFATKAECISKKMTICLSFYCIKQRVIDCVGSKSSKKKRKTKTWSSSEAWTQISNLRRTLKLSKGKSV